MSVRRETEQREAIDDGRAHSRYALSSLTRVSCHSPRREEWAKRALHVPLTHSAVPPGGMERVRGSVSVRWVSDPREGREVGERYGHSRRLRLSRSLLSPRLFPPLSIPALSLPSFFRSERAAGEWREGKRREERELNGKLSHVPGLTHRFHAPITSARRMFVPGSLVTSLTLHSHPRSRGERSGSERSEKERNEPREMGCEGGRGSFTQPLVLSSRVFHLLPSPRPAAGMNERRGTRRQGGKRLRQNDPRTQPLRSVVPSVLGSFHSPHTSVSRS